MAATEEGVENMRAATVCTFEREIIRVEALEQQKARGKAQELEGKCFDNANKKKKGWADTRKKYLKAVGKMLNKLQAMPDANASAKEEACEAYWQRLQALRSEHAASIDTVMKSVEKLAGTNPQTAEFLRSCERVRAVFCEDKPSPSLLPAKEAALDKVVAYIQQKVLPVLRSVQQHEQQLQRQAEKQSLAQAQKTDGAVKQEHAAASSDSDARKGKGKGDAAQTTQARRKRTRPGNEAEAELPPSKRLLHNLARMAAGLWQEDGSDLRNRLARALPELRNACVCDIHYNRTIK